VPQLDTGLTVRFELLGREETRITEWEIDSSYLVSTDGFSFSIYSEDPDELRNLELQPVELIVQGQSQGFGRVDITEIGGKGGREVHCMGRDYIADIVECNVDPSAKFADGTVLADALREIVTPCGITNVFGPEDVAMSDVRTGKHTSRGKSKRHKIKVTDDYKPKPGEGMYEFCNRVVARHGATIQPGPARDTLIIDRPNYLGPPLYSLTRTTDPTNRAANNVISATARRDYSKFPTFVLFTGTQGKAGKDGSGLVASFGALQFPYNSEMAGILSAALAPARLKAGELQENPGILYRLLHHRDLDARSSLQLWNNAFRAYSDRTKDSLIYTATVKGHRDPRSGALWACNTMVNVNDSICGINEPLWIASRKFAFRGGATTQLECWRPEAFDLGDVEEDKGSPKLAKAPEQHTTQTTTTPPAPRNRGRAS
jgi:prophage tail gpP-like protein